MLSARPGSGRRQSNPGDAGRRYRKVPSPAGGFLPLLGARVLGVIVLLIIYYALSDIYSPFTTEAYVQAYVVQVAPQVGEKVVRVHVREGDQVKAGTLLFELDPSLFEQKVASLEAKLVEAQYQVKQLEAELAAAGPTTTPRGGGGFTAVVYRQEKAIYKTESTTERALPRGGAKEQGQPGGRPPVETRVRRIEDALDARIGGDALVAQVRLTTRRPGSNWPIRGSCPVRRPDHRFAAPRGGLCSHRPGGDDTDRHRPLAGRRQFPRERACPYVRRPVGLDARGARAGFFRPRASVGWGVSQGQGVPSGQLPDVKMPTNWVPPARRFQVRLILDEPDAVPLRVGMTGSVAVYTEPEGTARSDAVVAPLIAWLYYL